MVTTRSANPAAPVSGPTQADPRTQLPDRLPLSAIERVFYVESTRQCPKTVTWVCEFHGSSDRDALVTALRTTMVRHPFVTAKVIHRWGHPYWLLQPVGKLPLEFRDLTAGSTDEPNAEVPSDLPTELRTPSFPRRGFVEVCATPSAADSHVLRSWFDLTREHGFRMVVMTQTTATGKPRETWYLQFHHACTDGLGAKRFLADLLVAYHNAMEPQAAVELDPIDPQRLLHRGELINRPASLYHPASTPMQRFRDAIKFVLANPQPLASPRRWSLVRRPVTNERPVWLWDSLSVSLTSRLEEQAAAHGVTVNDVAVAALFKTLVDWNRDHGQLSSRKPLRVIVPTDLRVARDLRAPAMNRLSLAFVSLRPGECDSMAELVPKVSEFIKYIRKSRISLDLLQNYDAIQKIPGLFPAALATSGCMATALLTNVGDPMARMLRHLPAQGRWPCPGGLLFHRLIGVAAIRKGTHAGFCLVSHAGEIAISLQVTPELFSQSDGRELLDRFIAEMTRWIEAAAPAAVS